MDMLLGLQIAALGISLFALYYVLKVNHEVERSFERMEELSERMRKLR